MDLKDTLVTQRKGLWTTLGILCSPCTCWVPKNPFWNAQCSVSQGQNPIDFVGPKEEQSLVWDRREIRGFGDSWAEDVKSRVWNAEPPASSLLALSAAGKYAYKSVSDIGTAKKAQLLSSRALTKPWAGLDACCQVNSDLVKEAK